jgi:uncharacterized caspase-like protein
MAENDFALLIGNSDYGGELQRLEGPPNDLSAFAQWLADERGAGLKPENILVLADRVGELPDGVRRPCPARWMDVYSQFFEVAEAAGNEQVDGKRRLWMLFAGHGNMPARQFGIDPITACFVPQDWRRRQPNVGWIVPVEYLQLCANMFEPFDEIVVFMDCCRSETSELREPARPFGITSGGAPPNREFVVICAAQADRLAYERPIGGTVHGVFTASLLDGLKTLRGPGNRLSVGMLLDYVRNAYSRHFADRRTKPEPELLDAESSTAFLLVGGEAAVSDVAFAAVQTPPGTYVQIVDGDENVICGFALEVIPVVRKLKTGLYEVVDAGGAQIRMFKHTEAAGRTVDV